jgi:Zn-dependent protease with chaperone function
LTHDNFVPDKLTRTGVVIFLLALYVLCVFSPAPAGIAAERELDPQVRREIEIGRRAVEQIEQRWELIADPVRIAHLTMIAERLSPHMERDIPYEVRIIRSDIPNAFCLPGGFIFFTSGMLELLSSDSEIAAIMAHEMVHVDQSHGIRMAARANRLSFAALAATVLSGGAMAPVILAQVGSIAMTSAYSIEFEKEADSMGMDVLIAAGYSPAGMITVMEKFMQQEMRRPIRDFGIYMTHPESAERVRSMKERLRSLNIPIQRKIPLQLLRTSIKADGGKLRLLIDGVEVWRGGENEPTLEILKQAQELLDRDFQMEMAPFDLRLEGGGESGGILRIKNNILARSPLPEGMPDLPEFRENLLGALARAHSRHPVAMYLR